MGMLRHDLRSRTVRLLGLTILCLQISGAAAIADARGDHRPPTGPPEVAAAVPPADAASPVEPVVPPPVVAPAPPPPTTAAPAPPPPPPPVPAPRTAPAPASPPPPPAPPAPPADPAARVQAAYDASVPAAWRDAIPVRLEVIEGNTSWAFHDGTIQIGRVVANGKDAILRATIAHEFGHLVAFRYGSQAFNGAAPEGWPAYGARPEEAWGDCVSRALTGINDPSHGLPPCEGGSLGWTVDWMAAGPGAHPRTGT